MNIHLFDVDHTMVRKSSSYYFLLEAMREGVLSFRQFRQLPGEWIRYQLGLVHYDFIEQAVKHFAGIERSTIDRLAKACFDRNLKYQLYVEGIQLVNEVQKRGDEVYFATSSFQNLVKPLEQFLGTGTSIASSLEFVDEKTTGNIDGKALFGPHKREAVIQWLATRSFSSQNVWFYSDSYTDIPLLEFVGHPVAVNPDRILRKHARKHGWTILSFQKTASKRTYF
jgi:HAD superfamily hydrolase (TIGR01490 family)